MINDTLLPLINNSALLENLENKLSKEEQLWLSGYLFALSRKSTQTNSSNLTIQSLPDVVILYGTQTGNSNKVARLIEESVSSLGFKCSLIDMNEYQPQKLTQQKLLFIAVSTYGDGEPPASAESLYNFVFSNRCPQLDHLNYSIIALGDRSYPLFCKTGIDFDKQLEKLGAKRICERLDVDVDFENDAKNHIELIKNKLTQNYLKDSTIAIPKNTISSTSRKLIYNRKHPFEAAVIEKIQLNGRGSEKETWHIELALNNSGLNYKPGDSIGIYPVNNPNLVNLVLECTQIDGQTPVEWNNDLLPFYKVLSSQLELSLIDKNFLNYVQKKTCSEVLFSILNNPKQLKSYIYGRDINDVLKEFPSEWTASELTGVLRPIQARMYSIASSLLSTEDELHVLIGAVRYHSNDRYRLGTTSTWLADSIEIGDKVRIFVEENEYFKLPENAETPLIFIGAGTGIAPFRAFAHELEENKKGNSTWLFFGNPHFTTDFLYQTEWQRFIKNKSITKISTAWSRDQEEKIYVQDKLLEHKAELFHWIESGAQIYVCGDKNKMAKDVEATLLEIIVSEGRKSHSEAKNYISNLKILRRYIEDIY